MSLSGRWPGGSGRWPASSRAAPSSCPSRKARRSGRLTRSSPSPERSGWKRLADTLALDQAAGKDGSKLFSKAKAGWIGSINDSQALFITFSVEPSAPHPAGEGFAEVYSCKKFVELEHVGRLESLKPGEHATLKERWRLFPAPPANFTAAERAAWMSAKALTP